METTKSAELLHVNQLEILKKQVFNTLDISDVTRNDYLVRIKHFVDYTQKNGLNNNTFLEYKRFLATIDTYSTSTKNKYLISAKVFLDGLYRLQIIPIKLTDNIRGFNQNKLHKKNGITDADIERIQNYCQTLDNSKYNLRLRALIALFLFQGLRQIEVSRLNVSDLDLKNKTTFIIGKGRDDKEQIHLHPTTVKILRDYLNCYRYRDGALFRSESNHNNGSRLTTKSIREIIKSVFCTLNIDGTTHGFRHYFITKLIQSYKGELLMVSKYSRHKSIQMLEVYNDEIIRKDDLPRYYNVFNGIAL